MCNYCGSTDKACHRKGGYLRDVASLTADDWRKMYNFIREVELPFVHSLILSAEAKAGRFYQSGKLMGSSEDYNDFSI